MAFIEPMHRNKPNITYLLTPLCHNEFKFCKYKIWKLILYKPIKENYKLIRMLFKLINKELQAGTSEHLSEN